MSRRVAAVLIAVLVSGTAVVGSSASRPASAADDAASVNGESIPVDDFEDVLLLAGAQLADYAVDPRSDTVSADSARDVLNLMIVNRAEHQFLRRHGMSEPNDEARHDAEATLDEGGTSWATGALREELIDSTVYTDQLGNVAAPDIESLRGRYEDSPLGLGALCARRIPVDSSAEGEALIAAASDGEDVAEGVDVECVPRTTVGPVPLDVEPGQAVGPLPSQDGTNAVYVIAQFDESIESLTALFGDAEGAGTTVGDMLFLGWLVSADITVNPRYGRWDAASASIVALSQP